MGHARQVMRWGIVRTMGSALSEAVHAVCSSLSGQD